jgi:hypothetical protein
MRHRVFLIVAVTVAPWFATAQADIPAFVSQLIARQHTGVGSVSAPGSIWRYQYRGRMVYYVHPRFCCDLMSRLYDAEGKLLCYPSGGIAGGGDGECTDFFRERLDEELLWRPGADAWAESR